MRSGLSFCIIVIAFVAISVVPVGEAVAKGCMAGGCHQELARVKHLHGPVAAEMAGVDACIMCHLPSGANCSENRGGKYKIKLRGLCITCHAKGTGTSHSDKEIESKCLKCHDPHGSDVSRHMLRGNPR